MLLPVAPFLYAQGQYTRWKVGRLPDASGETAGRYEGKKEVRRLLAIGESTVAGIGAKSHSEAFTGQFSRHLSDKTGETIDWRAAGVSGITIRRAIDEILPNIKEDNFDYVVIALGGNDVFTVKSPDRFRSDLRELITIVRDKNPRAIIFLANVPMVRDFLALPNPLKYVLSRLAKLHHFNAIEISSQFKRVFYFEDVERVDDNFFSDGIHPSATGYNLWCESMVNSFVDKAGLRKIPERQKHPD